MIFYSVLCVAQQTKKKKISTDFLKETNISDDPLKLRDPFRRIKKYFSTKKTYKSNLLLKNNSYSNIPELSNISIDSISIVGIIIGKNRRAIATISNLGSLPDNNKGLNDDQIFVIKEGMKLGENNGVVKAIFPGGIVVVERIKNVYDLYEYIETIIPFG